MKIITPQEMMALGEQVGDLMVRLSASEARCEKYEKALHLISEAGQCGKTTYDEKELIAQKCNTWEIWDDGYSSGLGAQGETARKALAEEGGHGKQTPLS